MSKSILDRMKDIRIAVVGDLMLDKYIYGEATRISQEAPVPVILTQNEIFVPGGAANVALNVDALGCKCYALGVLGCDQNGERVFDKLRENNIDCSHIEWSKERKTTSKTRIVANGQQLARIDDEETQQISEKIITKIENNLENLIINDMIDGIIFEDYAKGVLENNFVQRIIGKSSYYGVTTAIDPSLKNSLNITGMTIMTPNRTEAFEIVGKKDLSRSVIPLLDQDLINVGKLIIKKFNPKILIITLGENGLLLFYEKDKITHIPTRAIEVFDVSGAGDTVISCFTSAFMASLNVMESAKIANVAAGIVVGKHGTSTVLKSEIQKCLLKKD